MHELYIHREFYHLVLLIVLVISVFLLLYLYKKNKLTLFFLSTNYTEMNTSKEILFSKREILRKQVACYLSSKIDSQNIESILEHKKLSKIKKRG